MKTGWMIAAALLLAGCVSLRAPASAQPQLAQAMASAIESVQQVATDLEAGDPPDFETAAAQLERAQTAATATAITAQRADLAGHAALGVALGLCGEGLQLMEGRLMADAAAGPGLATAWRLGCVAPLLLITAG